MIFKKLIQPPSKQRGEQAATYVLQALNSFINGLLKRHCPMLMYQVPCHSCWVSNTRGKAHQKYPPTHPWDQRGDSVTQRWDHYSNGSYTDTQPGPAKAAGKSLGTLYRHPLLLSLMLFITLAAVTDTSGRNMILERIIQVITGDLPPRHQSHNVKKKKKTMLLLQ